MNSPEFRTVVRMLARTQMMAAIVKVLFWVTMAAMVAFCIWVAILNV